MRREFLYIVVLYTTGGWTLKNGGEILDKVKGMGFEVVTTYIPWEIHEVKKGVFDFGEREPSKDIDKFLTICEEKGLKVLARPGPQINSDSQFAARLLIFS